MVHQAGLMHHVLGQGLLASLVIPGGEACKRIEILASLRDVGIFFLKDSSSKLENL